MGAPTLDASEVPSLIPTNTPSKAPSGEPSSTPSDKPSWLPSKSPTGEPSNSPTMAPTDSPTVSGAPIAATAAPTTSPITVAPTGAPTAAPTTAAPTGAPIVATTVATDAPTVACDIDTAFRVNGKTDKDCLWVIKKGPDSGRVAKMCTRSDIKEACPSACGVCCGDDPLYTFDTEWVGEKIVLGSRSSPL